MYQWYLANIDLKLLGVKIYKTKTIEQIEDQIFCNLPTRKIVRISSFFVLVFCNWYHLEKNFVLLNV